MPKNSAPTVAEHRASRRAQLLLAGEIVLREEGLDAVTPRRVCEHAGLARTTFYDYFETKNEFLVSMAIEAFRHWDAEISETLAGVERGLPALRAFVEATLAMTAKGGHEIAGALQKVDLAPGRMEDMMELHVTLLRPVIEILDDMGVAEPHKVAMYIEGVLNVGVQHVNHGVDYREVADEVFRFVTQGLQSQ